MKDGETNNDEQLWVITSFTEHGNAFKIANMKHGLFLCAHIATIGGLLAQSFFVINETASRIRHGSAFLPGPVRPEQCKCRQSSHSWHVEHVRTFAGFSQTPAPTTPAAGSDAMGIAAAAGAAGAVLGLQPSSWELRSSLSMHMTMRIGHVTPTTNAVMFSACVMKTVR